MSPWLLILLAIVIAIVFGGVGGPRLGLEPGYGYGISVGTVVVVILILWLVGVLR